jgi:hypothetical protein
MRLPNAIAIALWGVGALCVVGLLAFFLRVPGEVVVAVAGAGLAVAAVEFQSRKSK